MTPQPQTHCLRTPAKHVRTGVILALCGLLAVSRLCAGGAIKTYPSLTLKDGRQFAAVQIINYTPNGVLVRHAEGATTFRFDVLPEFVIAALHLRGWEAEAASLATAGSSLADKPAVADSSALALANRAAVTDDATAGEDIADRPAIAIDEQFEATVSSASQAENLASAPAVPADVAGTVAAQGSRPVALPAAAETASSSAGEGNMPEFFHVQNSVVNAMQSTHVDLAGRIVVTLPAGGTHFIGDVEVRAYPAQLLTAYVAEAKVQASEASQRILAQAQAALHAGRAADHQMLAARAQKAASSYLEYLPAAPVSARSDEFGSFTLRHSLRDLRLVASGRVASAQGEWTFEWVGVAPEKDGHLTETNATSVVPAALGGAVVSQYASR